MAARNIETVGLAGSAYDVGKVALHIENPLTILAHAVIMLMAVMVIAGGAVEVPNVHEFAGLRHVAQVSIHGSFADRRVMPSDMRIDLFGCRVAVQFLHRPQNQPPLDGIPPGIHCVKNTS